MDTHTFLQTQAKSKPKAGLKLIIIGAVIAICGALVIPAILIFSGFPSGTEVKEYTVPGSFSVDINKTGQYYLWNHTRVVYKGVTLSYSNEPPKEMSISVSDQDGNPLRLIPDQSYTVTTNGTRRSSIGYVHISKANKLPMKVNVNVEGTQRNFNFSLSEFNFSGVLRFSLGIIGILFAIVAIGAGFIIVGAKKLLLASETKAVTASSN